MFWNNDLFEKWFPYWMWECFLNGMWDKRRKMESNIKQCKELLSDKVSCKEAMLSVIREWPISSAQHLSKSTGCRPWLGQAACCYAIGATEEETRIAWNFYMSVEQQTQANAVADSVIDIWQRDYA
jgi:hypothetical protein